jgi:Tfp pilus assembly protein PilV
LAPDTNTVRIRVHRVRGTTLAELLVAVVFLAACTSAILGCVWSSQTQGGYASRRSAILAAVQAQIYAARAGARSSTLVVGTTTTQVTVSGLQSTVPVVTTVTLVSGYTDLYQVSVTATWTETAGSTTRTDKLTIATNVRSPDA